MENKHLYKVEVHCVICTALVPTDRLKYRRITCSDACNKIRERQTRKRVDDRECRFCHKPSTPTGRRAFAKFRKWEREFPDQAHPELWNIVSEHGMTVSEFGKAIHQSVKWDFMLDASMAQYGWGSTKQRPADADPTPELDRVLAMLEVHPARGEEDVDV